MLKRFTHFVLRTFRKLYEDRINLPYGVSQFLANVAFIQLTSEEFIMLNPPSAYCGDIYVTVEGVRPVLTFPYWPKGMEYPTDPKQIPIVQVIVERNDKFQVKGKDDAEWAAVTIDDPRVHVLKDLFLGFAFYAPLRSELKQKKQVPA